MSKHHHTSACVSMPLGRHRGVPLGRIPSAYLAWSIQVLGPALPLRLRDALVQELRDRRCSWGLGAGPVGAGPQDAEAVRAVRQDGVEGDPGPRPMRPCKCCHLRPVVRHAVDVAGMPRLRATCPGCKMWTDTPPYAAYTREAADNEELDRLEGRSLRDAEEAAALQAKEAEAEVLAAATAARTARRAARAPRRPPGSVPPWLEKLKRRLGGG
jgi:hypothetical protein